MSDYTYIKQIIKVYSENEVNQLLSKGWILIKIIPEYYTDLDYTERDPIEKIRLKTELIYILGLNEVGKTLYGNN